MNPKSVFLEDKPLVAWWTSVVRDQRFEKVSALAVAAIAAKQSPASSVGGAIALLDTFDDFAEPEPKSSAFPSPGLIHDIPIRKIEQPKA